MTANPLTATPLRPPGPARNGWTAGRVIALVTGSVLLLVSLALLAGGGILAWADEEQQHSGYVTTSTVTYSTRGYALASDAISLHDGWGWLGLFVDEVRAPPPASPSGPTRGSRPWRCRGWPVSCWRPGSWSAWRRPS